LRNLITDVPGLKVGHADDTRLGSGATAIVFDVPAVGSIDVRGGGPGTRETALLDRRRRSKASTRSRSPAARLSASMPPPASGLAQGQTAASPFAGRVPIVPAPFDLLSGGDKEWGRFPPYRELGYAAAAAAGLDFALGSVGAGLGATTVDCKGGLGSASAQSSDSHTVGALAAVNAAGSVLIDGGPWFWAAPFEARRRVRRVRATSGVLRRGTRTVHQGQRARARRSSSSPPTPC
jgi:D-aminopeptidase